MTIEFDSTRSSSGTSLRGYLRTPWSFPETVARLITLSGQQQDGTCGDAYKTSVEFVGTADGRVFTLYDYKGDGQIHIGGAAGLDADRLTESLVAHLADAAPADYEAALNYDDLNGRRHGWRDGAGFNEADR